MSRNMLPSAQHSARALRGSVRETADAFHELDGADIRWSYNPSVKLARAVFSGELSLGAALQACRRLKTGSKPNENVVRVIWEHGKDKNVFCHDLKSGPYPLGQDLFVPVRAKFFFVENNIPHIFWLQPWKEFLLNRFQLGFLATVLKDFYAIDEFENAELYLLDVSRPPGARERQPVVYKFGDLPLLDEDEFYLACRRLAEAHKIFIEERPPKPKSERRTTDVRHPGLFDD